jgi:hypothetical protein
MARDKEISIVTLRPRVGSLELEARFIIVERSTIKTLSLQPAKTSIKHERYEHPMLPKAPCQNTVASLSSTNIQEI